MTVLTPDTVLSCESVFCDLGSPQAPLRVLHDIDFTIAPRTTLGVVGESGAGKSMLVKAIMGLVPSGAKVGGRIALSGVDLAALRPEQKRTVLGRKVGIVFQNPMTSLNPFARIGRQIDEACRLHLGLSKVAAKARAVELLAHVGIPDAAECYEHYPHQFSGGMKQRIMIATALACDPDLLIADEATTALDVTVQRDILDLLQVIQSERQMAMILVTHNLGVVAGRTDFLLVLYGGRVVEYGPTRTVFSQPRHRYTEALLAAMPRMDQPAHTRLATIPGRPPDLKHPPAGCPFAPRCPAAIAVCHETMPPMSDDGGRRFACYVPVPSQPVDKVHDRHTVVVS